MTTEAAELPKVSFCSQVFNQADWAHDMIDHVRAQTYQNWELLIVDDGSADDLKGVCESFNDPRIIYHRFEENKGVPFGTNWALKHATGKYICLIAADEKIAPTKLEEQVDILEKNPKVDCVWGLPGNGDDNFPMGHRPEWEQYHLHSHNRSNYAWLRTLVNLERVPIGGCGLMMKKSVADALGGLNEDLRIFSDHEFYCRFFEAGYKGLIVPIRWAIDRPIAENKNSVRGRWAYRSQQEHEWVRQNHPIVPPPQDGKVCVGITNHNYSRYLVECVKSVLAQTRPADEIMVLDDASTDDFDSVAVELKALDPRIKVMKFKENMGNAEGMSYMAFTTECDWFVSLAADDTLAPTYIEKCLNEFVKDPWLEFVACQTDFFSDPDSKVKWEDTDLWKIPKAANHPTRYDWLESLKGGNYYFGPGMYRTYAVREVGGWEKEYKVLNDYQMYLKLLQRENIKIVEEDLAHTRVHGNNYSLMSEERHRELPWLYHNAKKRFYPQKIKVVIATPFYELKAFSPYVVSLTQTTRILSTMGIEWAYMEISGDSYVHRARNTLCDRFLEDPDATHLFFIDSDMSWNPEAFIQMVLLPDAVVGGSYPVKNLWEAWTSVPKFYPSDEDKSKKTLKIRKLKDGSEIVEADVLAGGFLRIRREALERFREKYPDDYYLEPSMNRSLNLKDAEKHKFTKFFASESINGTFFGEDHYFAKKLRDAGIPMTIFANANLTHWGYKAFEGNYNEFLLANRDKPTQPTVQPVLQ